MINIMERGALFRFSCRPLCWLSMRWSGSHCRSFVGAAIVFLVSLIFQGRRHKLETTQPEPFKDGLDFVLRLFAEQWITFPRFVLTDGWFENLYKTATKPASWDERPG